MIIRLEGFDKVASNICCCFTMAAIESYLSTTGLRFGECDINAKVPEHFNGRFPYFWKKLVHEAGCAKSHPYPGGLPTLSTSTTSIPCHSRNVAEGAPRHNRQETPS